MVKINTIQTVLGITDDGQLVVNSWGKKWLLNIKEEWQKNIYETIAIKLLMVRTYGSIMKGLVNRFEKKD